MRFVNVVRELIVIQFDEICIAVTITEQYSNFPYENQLKIFEKPPCAAGALLGFPKIFKLIKIFNFLLTMHSIWFRTVDFEIDYLHVLLFLDSST